PPELPAAEHADRRAGEESRFHRKREIRNSVSSAFFAREESPQRGVPEVREARRSPRTKGASKSETNSKSVCSKGMRVWDFKPRVFIAITPLRPRTETRKG